MTDTTLFNRIADHSGIVNHFVLADRVEFYGEMHGDLNGFIRQLSPEMLEDYIVLLEHASQYCTLRDEDHPLFAFSTGIDELYYKLARINAPNLICFDKRVEMGLPSRLEEMGLDKFFEDLYKGIQDTMDPVMEDLDRFMLAVVMIEDSFTGIYKHIYDQFIVALREYYTLFTSYGDRINGRNSFVEGVSNRAFLARNGDFWVDNLRILSSIYIDTVILDYISRYPDKKIVVFTGAAHVHRIAQLADHADVKWVLPTPQSIARRIVLEPREE